MEVWDRSSGSLSPSPSLSLPLPMKAHCLLPLNSSHLLLADAYGTGRTFIADTQSGGAAEWAEVGPLETARVGPACGTAVDGGGNMVIRFKLLYH